MKKKYHITQREDGKWQGKLEKGQKASVVSGTKAEAMKKTVEMAKNYNNSQVFVHKQDGKIQEERTYGSNDDPKTPG